MSNETNSLYYYSENNEDYEKCIEIKSVIEEYKKTKGYKSW